jgi:DNA-binding Lrp family transcriptional regulator
MGIPVKEFDLRVLRELMKNSRRSDRKLAKLLGVSAPTVTRSIHRLEQEGYINEYTVIPNFLRLGYKLMGFSFVELEKDQDSTEQKKFQKFLNDFEKENPHAELISVSGMGMNKDYVFVSFFKDFSEYAKIQNISKLQTFFVDLRSANLKRVLSMSAIANHIMLSEEKE